MLHLHNHVNRYHYPLTLLLGVLAVVMLFSYPWEFLSIVSIAYLALIPVSIRSQRRLAAADARRAAGLPSA